MNHTVAYKDGDKKVLHNLPTFVSKHWYLAAKPRRNLTLLVMLIAKSFGVV